LALAGGELPLDFTELWLWDHIFKLTRFACPRKLACKQPPDLHVYMPSTSPHGSDDDRLHMAVGLRLRRVVEVRSEKAAAERVGDLAALPACCCLLPFRMAIALPAALPSREKEVFEVFLLMPSGIGMHLPK
jgi:hypothetical protein